MKIDTYTKLMLTIIAAALTTLCFQNSIKDGDKTFIGYSLYEEDDEPKLYYVEGYDL